MSALRVEMFASSSIAFVVVKRLGYSFRFFLVYPTCAFVCFHHNYDRNPKAKQWGGNANFEYPQGVDILSESTL